MSLDVVVLVGNPRAGSRTRQLAETLTETLLDRIGLPPNGWRVLELADIVGVSFGPEPAYGNKAGPDPFATVASAQLLIVATPAYKGSYTGLLKVFLDRFGHRQLAEVTAVPVVVAASQAHADAAAAALHDVLAELGARVPAPALAVLESRLEDGRAIAAQWTQQHAGAFANRPITTAGIS
ncbi:FMN reductase [Rhizocola hellebori]|uniref:FMN reductase n=1 Tax=Rhizocola hellebori TaxID=1392758 RepID=A0A8J3VJ71_9ACTN|nr:NAD(P)H-dependent oxidoreductase [Rhizocola hellebori]GIH07708.1 FMN reductase [Rhizocola hellebori]